MKITPRLTLFASMLALACTSAQSKVTHFNIESESLAFGGQTFAEGQTYKRINATAHFAVSPTDPQLAHIVDIKKMPTNSEGKITFSTQVTVLTPTKAQSDTLFYEVVNRGTILGLSLIHI